MSKYLFGRIVKVVIGTTNDEALVFNEDFRITFDVKSNLTSVANTAIIQLYNLSPATRATLSGVIKRNTELGNAKQPLLTLTLYAGYSEGDGYKIVFNGNITRMTTMQSIPDYITKIECGNGALPIKTSLISQSYKAGIDSNTIINQIARTMKLNISQASNYLQNNVQFAQGVAFSGLAKTFMDKIAVAANLTWYIDNGSMVIVEKGGAKLNEVILISPTTGMLKSPEKLENQIGDTAEVVPTDGWKVTCLLMPDITPLQKIKIESKLVDGSYIVESVEHKGDNRGQDWTTTFQTKFLGL